MTQKQNTIIEDYVSFEIAKLLKDKGFNEPCETSYYTSVSMGDFTKVRPYRDDLIAAPTHQMAMKWLREVKGIYITIGHGDYPSLKKHFFIPTIEDLEAVYGVDDEEVTQEFDTYEEAVEAALKYCLTKVI